MAALGHAGARFCQSNFFGRHPSDPTVAARAAWRPRRPGRKVGESRRAAACAYLMAATNRDRRPATPRASASAGIAGRKLARARKLRRSSGEGRGTGGGREVVAAVGARPHGAHRRFARSPLAASSAIGALRAPPRPSVPWSTPAEGRGQQAVGTALCYGGGGAPRRSASKQQSRQCPATTQACHVQPATRRHRWWWAALEGARAAAGRPVDARATRTTQPCVRSRAARLGLVRPLE